jgi:hypothetical protein
VTETAQAGGPSRLCSYCAIVYVFSTKEAAAYLGVAAVTIRHHIYNVKDLVPDKMVEGVVIFCRTTLDEFRDRPRKKRGRPKRVHA